MSHRNAVLFLNLKLLKRVVYFILVFLSWFFFSTHFLLSIVLAVKRVTLVEFCLLAFGLMSVGPCHHGMARPQVADGGTASIMEGSCE